MKRGLVVYDPQDYGESELANRIRCLQESLRRNQVDVALVYGDVYHSGDISYLSNICIYWNEGILAIPHSGEPAFLTKLSRRVHPWMRKTSILSDMRSGPNLEDLVTDFLKQIGSSGVVGLVEMEWWPGTLVDNMKLQSSNWQFKNLGPLVRNWRKQPSQAELRLLKRGAEITTAAINEGLHPSLSNPQRVGNAERVARMAGVEDIYVFCREINSEANCIEVLTEFRGYWTGAARVIDSGVPPTWMTLMEQAYDLAAKSLGQGVGVETLNKVVSSIFGHHAIWHVDLIHHTDIETRGDYRLAGETDERLENGAVVLLRLELHVDTNSCAVLADTYQILGERAQCLTNTVPMTM
ncbi:hypothetical protein [Alicyclobacillus kakegawensis]|uniref:hypothetical protein n=1 Tax=Alicyclobacillus kakegawensis TaxID=392012 RepID=UPI000835C154|nr:hypothetical protein [Alicyclobacillus kakegawensis]